MRPFSTIQLLALADAYCAATGDTLHALSGRVSDKDNHKLFGRLKEGRGCSAEYLERASLWFVEHWPADVAWPETVPREWAA